MPFEYIYDLCKWNFLHRSKNISIASLFIDMHGAIDLLNFKYGNVASTRRMVQESMLFGSAL